MGGHFLGACSRRLGAFFFFFFYMFTQGNGMREFKLVVSISLDMVYNRLNYPLKTIGATYT
jgi:hypothetical protein